ncbi:hypothetical protein F5B19DRAFT_460406 [Rostrohypoxylon terebratum]|nr:hypothetical protein F5B19DRAFT_460406 [Rostrohypoxylon terebratum]
MNLLAQEGMRALANSLPILISEPFSQTARSSALYDAWLCGIFLGSVRMSIQHKLCHTSRGSFNLPHSETHTIVLPDALSYNAPKASGAMKALVAVLPGGQGDATKGLSILLPKLKVERGLKVLRIQESDIDKVADTAVSIPCRNPRPIGRGPIRELIW